MIGWRTDHQVHCEQLGLTWHETGKECVCICPSDWKIMCTVEQHKCKIQFACICKYSICKCGCVDCDGVVDGGGGGVEMHARVCLCVQLCACVNNLLMKYNQRNPQLDSSRQEGPPHSNLMC